MSTDKECTRLATDIPGQPPTPTELGHSGWNILHGAAAVYPYHPSSEQQQAMFNFIHGFSYTYPCNWCAYHMRLYLKDHTIDVSDKLTVTRFMCEFHNNVNEHLGKDLFDCDPMHVLRRWHPGYPDHMEDKPSMEQRVAEEMQRLEEQKAMRERQRAMRATMEHISHEEGTHTRTCGEQQQQQVSSLTCDNDNNKNTNNKPSVVLQTSRSSELRGGGGGVMAWRRGASAEAVNDTHAQTRAPITTTPSLLTPKVVGVGSEEKRPSAKDGRSESWLSRAQSFWGGSWFTASDSAGNVAERTALPVTQATTNRSLLSSTRSNISPPPSRAVGHDTKKAEESAVGLGKVADDETNIDAILRRLKGCMVFCPDDDAKKV